ncbi:MAG TPA: endonuclease/exonuclease/phosphatase family protein, partial [Bacteroidales bacterium]|nr:endonuclease/exonuclease/phosphatase family protein [Bacteroidales bacterium]
MNVKRFFIAVLVTLLSVTAYGQYEGYDLNNINITDDAESPVNNITPYSENDFSRENTLDIVNWNVSWMGAPEMVSSKYGSRMEHIRGIAEVLVNHNADVFALQEVIVNAEGNALNDLVEEMNAIAGQNTYSGIYSEYHSFYWDEDDPEFPPQSLAYVWNNSTVTVNKDSALLQNESSYNNFGYGRLPYLLDANVTINGKTQRYMFINLHLKAQDEYSDMRASSMELLKKLLDVNFSDNNVVLTGDYNVADASGALGEITEWGMYNDEDGDGIVDYVHAGGNKNSGIEHTLISNELFDELAYLPELYRSMTISGTGIKLSDHYAYETSLYIYEETGNHPPDNNPLNEQGEYSLTMSKSDYQIIVDFVKNNPELAALDNSEYDDSEYYFGASAYYQNFDIRDGNHHSSFGSWQEAVQTGISLALLPEKFPNARVSDPVYTITFDTYSGSDKTYTFNFECTKSAPDPEFQYTIENRIDEVTASSEIH